MNTTYIYLTLIIYFLLATLVAYSGRRQLGRGMAHFFLANRAIGGFTSALTYSATTFSAFMMVGLAGFTYIGGVGAWGFELIYLSGLVLVAFFGPRFYLVGKRYNYITPTEMLGDRYQSKWLSILAALSSVIFLIPYSSVQLMGVGTLLEGMSGGGIPFHHGLIIATVIAITWAWMGGMRSVALTDSLQALIMVLAATLSVIFVLYRGFGGPVGLFSTLEREAPLWLSVPGPGFFNFSTFIGLSLPWFFFSLSNPQVSQRLFIPRSLTHMRTMIMGFLAFGFIYTLISILWGFSARLLLPDLPSGDMATPYLLATEFIPTSIALIVFLGITAAAISTINSILLSLSSMISRDVVRQVDPGIQEERELAIGKIFVPLFAVATFFFATLRLDLIAVLSVASSAGLLVMVPSIIGAFFWKRGTAAGAITSILVGGSTALFLQYSGLYPLGQWPGIWSGAVSLLLFIIISLLTKPPQEKAHEFLTYVQTALKDRQVV